MRLKKSIINEAGQQDDVWLTELEEIQLREEWDSSDRIKAEIEIKDRIAYLEAEQTPRRIRDVINGDESGWWLAQEELIAVLRADLIKLVDNNRKINNNPESFSE